MEQNESNPITSQEEELDQETLIDQDYEEFYNSVQQQKQQDQESEE